MHCANSSINFSVTDTNSSRTSEAALWPSTYISPLSNSTPCIRKDRISSKSLMRLSICLWKPSIGNFFSDKLVLTSVTPASSAPVLQTPKATSSTLYFDSLTVNAGNGGFLHCIQMDTSVNAANQVVSVGADIAFDADPKFFACLVRFESSSVPTTLP